VTVDVMAEGRHLAQRAFRQTGKTALRFDPARGRGGPGYSSIAPINDRQPGYSDAGCDLRSDRREGPRSAPFFTNLTV
jgi:hypothetical protein